MGFTYVQKLSIGTGAALGLQPQRPSMERRLTQRLSQVMMPSLPELQLTLNEDARTGGDRITVGTTLALSDARSVFRYGDL